MRRLRRFLRLVRTNESPARTRTNHLGHCARDVIGPIGAGFSDAWEAVSAGHEAYVQSFDRRLPPSTFVSERDRRRYGQPMPLVERRIGADRSDDITPAELEWARRPPYTD